MADSLLAAEAVTRRFGGVIAVEDVTLRIPVGGLVCIIGPNGAGKSTLFNMLCGTVRPTSGRILLRGVDITGMSVHQFARAGIARKFQIPSVFATMTVRDNLAVAVRGGSERDVELKTDEILQLLGMVSMTNATAGDLAHGQKQWLEIGMALMAEPQLLLLDEPTAGMTSQETQRTAQLLLSLSGKLAIVAIEHDMRFVRALNCHTMVLHQGRIIAEGGFAEIGRNVMVRDIYLGRQ
jgi:ABC-type uncharacterized transport system ATPase subunit